MKNKTFDVSFLNQKTRVTVCFDGVVQIHYEYGDQRYRISRNSSPAVNPKSITECSWVRDTGENGLELKKWIHRCKEIDRAYEEYISAIIEEEFFD